MAGKTCQRARACLLPKRGTITTPAFLSVVQSKVSLKPPGFLITYYSLRRGRRVASVPCNLVALYFNFRSYGPVNGYGIGYLLPHGSGMMPGALSRLEISFDGRPGRLGREVKGKVYL
jgi:hypothetical protein